MGTKAERRAARERVAAYHEARLGELSTQTLVAEKSLLSGHFA